VRDGDGKTTLVFVNACTARLSFEGSDIDGDRIEPGVSVCVNIGSDTESLPAKRHWVSDFNDFDGYNISHLDAFNLPMQIVSRAGESRHGRHVHRVARRSGAQLH
jgi:hypothetical protein